MTTAAQPIVRIRAARLPLGDDRPVPVLRPPRRRLSGGQRAASARTRRWPAATSARTSAARTAGACTTATTVPGFPGHPHRGFETVTIVRKGLIDHSDSLGATARFGGGDVQWLTAGKGIVHAEMFPLLDPTAPNPLELFQIWLNLPARSKMAAPHFTMLWAEDDSAPSRCRTTPAATTEVAVHRRADRRRPGVAAAAAAARLVGRRRPTPTSRSGRSGWRRARAGRCPPRPARRPAACSTSSRAMRVASPAATVNGRAAIELRAGAAVELVNAGDAVAEFLLLQGRPIGEPVVQYGPFVMNTPGRDRADHRRLPAHAVRRLAVAGQRAGARPRPGALRPPRRRPRGTPGAGDDRRRDGARGGLAAPQKMLGSATGAPNEVSRKSKSQPSSAWRMCLENIQP